MLANLIAGNEEGVRLIEYVHQYHMYAVGMDDFLSICVATAQSPFPEGEIISIDESIYGEKENTSQWIKRMAKDFEQFLIIAGNLNQIHRDLLQNDSNYEQKKQEFIQRLNDLKVDPVYHQAWIELI
jgi:hypothetical protein